MALLVRAVMSRSKQGRALDLPMLDLSLLMLGNPQKALVVTWISQVDKFRLAMTLEAPLRSLLATQLTEKVAPYGCQRAAV
jgi:hypothetical protein